MEMTSGSNSGTTGFEFELGLDFSAHSLPNSATWGWAMSMSLWIPEISTWGGDQMGQGWISDQYQKKSSEDDSAVGEG